MTGPTVARASIVIPAHNEASVIGRCLTAVAAAARSGDVEVVVACNGCSDDTAAIARRFENVIIVEIAQASKPAALRAGEAAVSAFPRVYLDADVVVSMAALDAVVARLVAESGPLAGRPPIQYRAEHSSWPVREYYAARIRIPSVMNSLWGAGIYALNRAARARFDQFPDVIGDDLWIDSRFERSEVVVISADPVLVNVPVRSGDLLRILRRTQAGKSGVASAESSADEQTRQTTTSVGAELRQLARSGPRAAISAVIYSTFALASRLPIGRSGGLWQRDERSRQLSDSRQNVD